MQLCFKHRAIFEVPLPCPVIRYWYFIILRDEKFFILIFEKSKDYTDV